MNAIPDRYPDEWTTDDILSLPSINSQLGAALSTFHAHLGSTSAESALETLSDLASTKPKFQKLLSSEIQLASLSSILSSAADNRDLSRLRSCRGKHAGRWLEAVPTSRMLALKPYGFRLAASARLGCPLAFTACVSLCECGSTMDPHGYHMLTCKFGGGPVWAHNRFVTGWSDCIRDVGLS